MKFDIKQVVDIFRVSMLESLCNSNIASLLWQTINTRNPALSHDVWQPYNMRDELFRLAAEQSAKYIEETILSDANGNTNSLFNKDFPSALELLSASVSRSVPDGLYLEFGVFSGNTISHIAGQVNTTVHGFDSFEGLAEDCGIWDKGGFSTGHVLPPVPDNVVLHKGWFDQTLKPFLRDNPGHLSFVHVDCDTCQSAAYVLEALAGRMVPGTVIQFDEFFNYPGWQIGEYKAFTEFVARHALRYEFVGYVERANCMAVRVVSIGEGTAA